MKVRDFLSQLGFHVFLGVWVCIHPLAVKSWLFPWENIYIFYKILGNFSHLTSLEPWITLLSISWAPVLWQVPCWIVKIHRIKYENGCCLRYSCKEGSCGHKWTEQVFAPCEGGLPVIFPGRRRTSNAWVKKEKNARRIWTEEQWWGLGRWAPCRWSQEREDSKWIECQSQSMRVRGEAVSVF